MMPLIARDPKGVAAIWDDPPTRPSQIPLVTPTDKDGLWFETNGFWARDEVEFLVERLQAWLKTGDLGGRT